MNNALAVITARGGSKRIHRKNIKNFLGVPIINYCINAALHAGCFNEVMVSTDDQEIARIAKESGAAVPFLRSAKTSDDYATTADVIEEVLMDYKKMGLEFEYCCCIYPTAPFVTPEKLLQGFSALQKGAHSVMPVVRFSYPIQRALSVENGVLKMIWPDNMNSRSQDLTPAYHDAGQFYWLRTDTFLASKKIFSDKTVPIIVPESEVQDIDNEEDWKLAELKYITMNNIHEKR